MKESEKVHKENIAYLERLFRDGEIPTLPIPTNLSIRFFKSGGGNHLYRINADGARYLARINYYPLKNQWQIKEHEFYCLRLVESLGIAPKAYFLDTSGEGIAQHCIIVDFLEGEPIEVFNRAAVVHLAATLNTLHASIQFDRPGDRLPPTDSLPYRCNIFNEYATGADKQIEQYAGLEGIEAVIEPFNHTRTKLGTWFNALTIFNGADRFSLCHADLKQENILKTAQGIQLIDWELAGSYLPETDIADAFSGCRFTPQQENWFLEHYYPDGSDQIALDRIYSVKKVLDFFRIMEDYIILHRKPWSVEAMLQEVLQFEKSLG